MIKNPGGGNLWNNKRFKVYTSIELPIDMFSKPKRDKSKCCGWGTKIVYPPNKEKYYLCNKCGNQCDIIKE